MNLRVQKILDGILILIEKSKSLSAPHASLAFAVRLDERNVNEGKVGRVFAQRDGGRLRKMKLTFSRPDMNRTRFSRGPYLGVLAALSLFSAVSVVRPTVAQAQTMQIGVVDEDKLADGFKKYSLAVAAIDKRAQDLDSKIPAREYLSDVEGKTFDTLIVKPSLVPTEAGQLDVLVKSGTARRAEYLSLIGTAMRDATQVKRMQVLQGYSTQNSAQLQQLSNQLLQLVRTQQDETDKQYTNQANDVVAQVAKDKKMLMIVRKKALIYSADAVDVTNEVLSRLNKG